MNRVKIFITFTFLLAFAFQISAQDKTPKLVWKNLQEKYENFYDIKPVIQNITDKPIYFYPTYKVYVLVFDEALNTWNLSKYRLNICSFGSKIPKREFVKIKSNEGVEISKWISWNFELLGNNGAFQEKDKPDWEYMPDYKTGRKYKLKITFSDKKFDYILESESPDFWVKPNI